MTNVIIRRSKMYVISWIILLIGLLTFGVILLFWGHAIAGIIIAISALIAIAMFLKGLTDSQPRITIDVEGITATEFSGIKILWGDIKKVAIVRIPRVGRIMTFELLDEEKYRSQLTEQQKAGQAVNKVFGTTSFAIIVEGLDTHPSIIYDTILQKFLILPL